VFFASDRNGSRDIFKQSLESRVPEAIVTGPEDEHGPLAVSPDGAWLYYLVSPRRARGSTTSGTAVWRTTASGGARDSHCGPLIAAGFEFRRRHVADRLEEPARVEAIRPGQRCEFHGL
jgi:hypothetical protein